MKILDNLAINIANRVVAKNDEVMLLEQENDSLKQKLAASELTVSDYQKKIKKKSDEFVSANTALLSAIKENERLESKYTEVKKRLKDLAESEGDKDNLISEYEVNICRLEETVKSLKKNMRHSEIISLKRTCKNQLNYIEILQVIASSKADKTLLKDVFSHNLSIYLDNNFNTMKQAENKLGINRTTLSELKSGKTALSYDNLDILDSKMCEYFECSVYELVTVKMEGEK